MVGEKIKRCEGFGTKFDEKDELCKKCEDALECMNKTITDNLDRMERKKPPILPLSKNTPPPISVMLSKNSLETNKLKMEIYIDKTWLKHYLFGKSKDEL